MREFLREFWKGIILSILFIIMVGVFIPSIKKFNEVGDKKTASELRDTLDLTLAQLEEKYQSLCTIRERFKIGINDPVDFFRFLATTFEFDNAVRKFDYTHPHNDQFQRVSGHFSTTGLFIPEIQEAYTRRFGVNKMQEARESFTKTNGSFDHHRLAEADFGITYLSVWPTFAGNYFLSLPFALVFFMLRLKFRGLRVVVEFWRLIPAAFFWPAAIFRYPTRIEIVDQAKAALRFATYTLSTLLSIMTAGVGIAKAQGKSTKKTSPYSIRFDIETLPMGGRDGLDDRYISPYYAWSLKTRAGQLSGGGALEFGNVDFITTGAINWTSPVKRLNWLSVANEIGGTAKGAFWQAGDMINITKLPVAGNAVSRVFGGLSLARYAKVSGLRVPNETKLAWRTRDLPIPKLGLSAYSEGFIRMRASEGRIIRPNVGRTEFWFSSKRAPNLRLGAVLRDGKEWAFGVKFLLFQH